MPLKNAMSEFVGNQKDTKNQPQPIENLGDTREPHFRIIAAVGEMAKQVKGDKIAFVRKAIDTLRVMPSEMQRTSSTKDLSTEEIALLQKIADSFPNHSGLFYVSDKKFKFRDRSNTYSEAKLIQIKGEITTQLLLAANALEKALNPKK